MSIEYDHFGRMLYNPDFHANNRTPWDFDDLQYLINWYDVIGAEELSFALERTITTVRTKACSLRKSGIMPKTTNKRWHKRIKKLVI